MGFRNPFRFSVDQPTARSTSPTTAPTRGSANPNRGPDGIVEWNVISQPGNYGWPYCHGDNIAYNDFNFATGTSGAKFDCANPVNDSPNNTGLTTLPRSIPADVYYDYGASAEFPRARRRSARPMAGPVYRFDAPSSPTASGRSTSTARRSSTSGDATTSRSSSSTATASPRPSTPC